MEDNLEVKDNEQRDKSGDSAGTGFIINADGTVDRKDTGAGDSIGETGNGAGTEPSDSNGNKKGNKRDRTGSKRNIIESIRNKKHQRDSDHASEEHRNIEGLHEGNETGNGGNNGGIESNGGIETRPNLGVVGDNGQIAGNDGNTDDNHSGDETNRRRVKPKGVDVKVPPLPKAEPKKPIEVKLEDVLTGKESKELQPRIKDALKTFFKFADKGIGFTTKKAESKSVFIWSTIDNDELDVIATAIVESGQKSKAIATMTRKISRDYQKLQIGIIMLPRFIMTVQHYMNNGFALPFGGNK